MNRPIAVFDAGIGSYAVVAEIQKRLPKQDIVYFADRAQFPYGAKAGHELLAVMRATIRFLEGQKSERAPKAAAWCKGWSPNVKVTILPPFAPCSSVSG